MFIFSWGREPRRRLLAGISVRATRATRRATVVYDFLPDTILDEIENLSDFLGALAFDKWMGNADSRQVDLFPRAAEEWIPGSEAHGLKMGFVAQMIDNGFVFDGPNWGFRDSAIQGLYFRPSVYRNVRGLADFEPWLARIVNFPEEMVDQAVKAIPPVWLEGKKRRSKCCWRGCSRGGRVFPT